MEWLVETAAVTVLSVVGHQQASCQLPAPIIAIVDIRAQLADDTSSATGSPTLSLPEWPTWPTRLLTRRCSDWVGDCTTRRQMSHHTGRWTRLMASVVFCSIAAAAAGRHSGCVALTTGVLIAHRCCSSTARYMTSHCIPCQKRCRARN